MHLGSLVSYDLWHLVDVAGLQVVFLDAPTIPDVVLVGTGLSDAVDDGDSRVAADHAKLLDVRVAVETADEAADDVCLGVLVAFMGLE